MTKARTTTASRDLPRGTEKGSWVGIPLDLKAAATQADLLSLAAKRDDGEAYRQGVREDRFSDSFIMATNGGATYEEVLRPQRHGTVKRAKSARSKRMLSRSDLHNALGVLRNDDRVLISDTSRIPARSVGLLKIIPEDGVVRYGTAWLIGPRVLATAAHNLLHPKAGRSRSLEVGMAYDGTNARGGWHRVVDCLFPSAWEKAPSVDNPNDFAVLKIDDPKIGNKLGWFGFADYDDDKFQDMVLNLFGYPVDLQTFSMYGSAGRALGVDERRIFYDCDAGGGMSGGPVIARFGERRIAVGIHVAGGDQSNAATRITEDAYNLFEQHKQW